MIRKPSDSRRAAGVLLLLALLLSALVACARPANDALADRPASDMAGYRVLADVDGPLQFVDMTAAEADRLMEEGASFVLFTSYPDCPWCNAVIRQVNAAAAEAGWKVGNINTRKDPSWQNNMDIDDYDLFVARFGEFLENDDDGTPHLYVPHIFFIRNGAVVYAHQGALSSMGDDPNTVLSEEENEELTEIFREGFRLLG